jgi:uroporphyrinogen-III synthase
MRLWITRAAPEAEKTVERLAALGHQPILAPLLQVHVLPGEMDFTGVAALAFTSANGVRAFAAKSPRRDLTVFAVGSATAHAAREAGFATVTSANGDSAALAAFIAEKAGILKGAVLHPAAREPAGDLVSDLLRLGASARSAPVYETRPMAPSADILVRMAQSPPDLDGILVHSARAAGQVAHVLDGDPAAADIVAYCISRAAAKPLAPLGLKAVIIAEQPNETALLARVDPPA